MNILLFAGTGTGAGGGGGMLSLLPFALIMLILYFLMIRPQSKRQKEKKNMIEALKKGDRVVTIGGIHGTITGFKNQGKVVVIKADKNTNLAIAKSAVAGLADNVNESDTVIEAQA